MIMSVINYTRINWEDAPSKATPTSAENLNRMDNAIKQLDDNAVSKVNPEFSGSMSMGRMNGPAVGENSVALGFDTRAEAQGAVALGLGTTATANGSFVEGTSNTASGEGSHAEGNSSTSSAKASHAEGSSTASGNYSHSEGLETKAQGECSHAEGNYTVAEGDNSHSEGMGSKAKGTCSHVEGYGCNSTAQGYGAHAEGYYTSAGSDYQHVEGKYNEVDSSNRYAHIIGGGTSDTDRKNIHTVDWYGNAQYSGDVTNGNGVSLDGLKSLIDNLTAKLDALTN